MQHGRRSRHPFSNAAEREFVVTGEESVLTTSTATPQHKPGRRLLALGLLVTVLGIAAYAVQLSAHQLVTPWYLPCTATFGVIFLIASLWQARTVWRILAMLLVTLVAAGEWGLLLTVRLPAYTGPIAAGKPFPVFAATQADGDAFTEKGFAGDQNSVLVVFRGRW